MTSSQQLCRSCLRSVFPDTSFISLPSSKLSALLPGSAGFAERGGQTREEEPGTEPIRQNRPYQRPTPADVGRRNLSRTPVWGNPVANLAPRGNGLFYMPSRASSTTAASMVRSVEGGRKGLPTQQSDGCPAPSEYPHLPAALFTSRSGSEVASALRSVLPADAVLDSNTNFFRVGKEKYVWKNELRAEIAQLSPVSFSGEGLTADEAVVSSYRQLLGFLHQERRLSSLSTGPQLEKETVVVRSSDAEVLYLQIYNYAASQSLIPQISVTRDEQSKGQATFTAKISLPERDIHHTETHRHLFTAQALAASAFKAEAEKQREAEGAGSLKLLSHKTINIDSAPGFLSYYSRVFKESNFTYVTSSVTLGSTILWKVQVRLNGGVCGESALLPTLEAARLAASVVAALHLEKSQPELAQEYLNVLLSGRGIALRKVPPVELQVDPNTVELLKDIHYEINARESTRDFKLSPKDLHETFRLLKPSHKLIQTTRLRSTERYGHGIAYSRPQKKSPVRDQAGEILRTINNNVFTILVGPTGSGKSTQVPQLILENAIANRKLNSCNICVAQPRRIGAQSLANRVAEEREELVGDVVGYRIANESRVPKSRGGITFSTAEMLQIQLGFSWDVILDSYSHIIVDEVHERDEGTESLLATLRMVIGARMEARKAVPRVVLMSATLHTDIFADFFAMSDSKTGARIPCPVIKVSGKVHPIEAKTLDNVVEELSQKMADPALQSILSQRSHRQFIRSEQAQGIDSDRSEGIIDWRSQWEISRTREERNISIALVAATIANICSNSTEGAILVFLPGMKEMKATHELLAGNRVLGQDFKDRSKFQFAFLHSSNYSGWSEAFRRGKPGLRKIILATNIAETSVTIPDVRYVVDSGLVRSPVNDHVRQLSRLGSNWTSQSSVIQRAGRAGRVQPGQYQALFSSRRFERMAPLMKRQSIRQSKLQMRCIRSRDQFPTIPIRQYFEQMLDPPDELELESAIRDLVLMGALTSKQELTYLGRVLAKFPGQPNSGRIVLLGTIFFCLEPMIIVAASMDNPKSLFLPPDEEKGEERLRAKTIREIYAQGTGSDHVAAVYAFRELQKVLETNGSRSAERWARESLLNFSVFTDMLEYYSKVSMALSRNLQIRHVSARRWNRNSWNLDLVQALTFGGLYPNVGIHKRDRVFTTVSGEDAYVGRHSSVRMSLDEDEGEGGGEEADRRLHGQVCCYTDLILGRSGQRGLLQQVTLVDPLAAALFGGRLEQEQDEESEGGAGAGAGAGSVGLTIGGWLPVRMSGTGGVSVPEASRLLLDFKRGWDRVLARLLETICVAGARRHLLYSKSFQRAFIDGIVALVTPGARLEEPDRVSARVLAEEAERAEQAALADRRGGGGREMVRGSGDFRARLVREQSRAAR